jgi:hypothetical protein
MDRRREERKGGKLKEGRKEGRTDGKRRIRMVKGGVGNVKGG